MNRMSTRLIHRQMEQESVTISDNGWDSKSICNVKKRQESERKKNKVVATQCILTSTITTHFVWYPHSTLQQWSRDRDSQSVPSHTKEILKWQWQYQGSELVISWPSLAWKLLHSSKLVRAQLGLELCLT